MAYTVGWQDIEEGVDTGLSANAKIREGFTNTQTALNGLDNRVNGLESFSTGLATPALKGASTAASQEPSTTNVPLTVEFGAAQNSVSDDVMMDVSGVVTFNKQGKYSIKVVLQAARHVTSQPASLIGIRWVMNATQLNSSRLVALSSDDINVPFEETIIVDAAASDTLELQIIRDSAGNDSGGLFSTVLNASGWASSPSATITILKLV